MLKQEIFVKTIESKKRGETGQVLSWTFCSSMARGDCVVSEGYLNFGYPLVSSLVTIYHPFLLAIHRHLILLSQHNPQAIHCTQYSPLVSYQPPSQHLFTLFSSSLSPSRCNSSLSSRLLALPSGLRCPHPLFQPMIRMPLPLKSGLAMSSDQRCSCPWLRLQAGR